MKALLSDFSHVLLKPRNKGYVGALNALHREAVGKFGDDYDALQFFELNRRLLDFYTSLKGWCSVSIFTTDVVQNHRQLRPQLDRVCQHIFAAGEHGLNKRDPAAYAFVAGKLGVRPEEVVYVDDDEENVHVAGQAGMTALRYIDDDETISALCALLSRQ